jgi:hypothetical protein
VRDALAARLGEQGKLLLLNSRLILRTGVNLITVRAAQAEDPRLVGKVLAALSEMGFNLDEPAKAKE